MSCNLVLSKEKMCQTIAAKFGKMLKPNEVAIEIPFYLVLTSGS